MDGAYHAVACGAVTALFSGSADALADLPASPPPPKSYGVEGLAFRLADGATRRFTPAGQLFFSDWRFEVFSRDCQWVALLVDHSGPYHLVRTAQLAGYLDGAVAPVVLQAKGEEASVHGDGRWTEDGRFEFTASCCGGAKALRATTAGEVTTLFEAAEAPRGLERGPQGFRVKE